MTPASSARSHPGSRSSTQPEGAAQLDAALQNKSSSDAGDDPPATVAELAHFDKAAQASGGPAGVFGHARGHTGAASLRGGLPTPLTIALAVTADAAPALRLKFAFATEGEAAQFAAAWPEIVRRSRQSTMLMGLGGALDGLAVHPRGSEVEIEDASPRRSCGSHSKSAARSCREAPSTAERRRARVRRGAARADFRPGGAGRRRLCRARLRDQRSRAARCRATRPAPLPSFGSLNFACFSKRRMGPTRRGSQKPTTRRCAATRSRSSPTTCPAHPRGGPRLDGAGRSQDLAAAGQALSPGTGDGARP